MAWTALTFSVGQILTAAQMNNLQSNFTALANGDTGAPAIQHNALDLKIIDKTNLIDTIAGDNWYPPMWLKGQTSLGGTSNYVYAEWIASRSGGLRCRFGTRQTSTADTSCVSVAVNSTVVTSEYCTNGTTFLNWTEDITVNIGDRIQFLARTTITGTLLSFVQFGVSSDSIKEEMSLVSSDNLAVTYA